MNAIRFSANTSVYPQAQFGRVMSPRQVRVLAVDIPQRILKGVRDLYRGKSATVSANKFLLTHPERIPKYIFNTLGTFVMACKATLFK